MCWGPLVLSSWPVYSFFLRVDVSVRYIKVGNDFLDDHDAKTMNWLPNLADIFWIDGCFDANF